MKQCVISTNVTRAMAAFALAGSAVLPTACGDDEHPGNPAPATGGTTNPPATGGSSAATGGAPPASGGAGGGPSGGAGGTGGGSGGTATGGAQVDVPDASPDSGDGDSGVKDTLDKTGLYAPGGGEVLATGVRPYDVRFQLWSDGATKKRYVYLPPNTKIDTTDMDSWVFPVGTKVWKEFTRGGVRVETRLLEKLTSSGPERWKHVAYVWDATQSEAVAAPDGKLDAQGTGHDVPDSVLCTNCHQEDPDAADKRFVLGLSAIQLAHDGAGVTLKVLADEGRLTVAPPSTTLPLPGNTVAQTALGTLHANCGMCHQPGTFAYEERAHGMDLRLTVATLATVQGTPTYRTTVNVTTSKSFEDATVRIQPGDAVHSALHQRMSSREDLMAMPPVATKLVDTAGSKAVSDWIISLGQ